MSSHGCFPCTQCGAWCKICGPCKCEPAAVFEPVKEHDDQDLQKDFEALLEALPTCEYDDTGPCSNTSTRLSPGNSHFPEEYRCDDHEPRKEYDTAWADIVRRHKKKEEHIMSAKQTHHEPIKKVLDVQNVAFNFSSEKSVFKVTVKNSFYMIANDASSVQRRFEEYDDDFRSAVECAEAKLSKIEVIVPSGSGDSYLDDDGDDIRDIYVWNDVDGDGTFMNVTVYDALNIVRERIEKLNVTLVDSGTLAPWDVIKVFNVPGVDSLTVAEVIFDDDEGLILVLFENGSYVKLPTMSQVSLLSRKNGKQ